MTILALRSQLGMVGTARPAVSDLSPPGINILGGATTGTTAAFNPPANSVLVAAVTTDPSGTTEMVPTITNNGAALTWLPGPFSRGVNRPGAWLFYAVLPAARTGMTVTVTFASAGGSGDLGGLKLYVVTDADTADPLGASSSGSSTANPATTTAFTTETANALGIVAASDYSNVGETFSADTTWHSHFSSGLTAGTGYKTLGAAGSAATFNLDVAGTAALDWAWASTEIRAAPVVATTPVAPVVRSSSSAESVASTTTVEVPPPAGLVAGDLLVSFHMATADRDVALLVPPTGFATEASQASNSTSNIPAFKIASKVADAADVAAATLTFGDELSSTSIAILVAIQVGTFNTADPLDLSAITAQAVGATLEQIAPSIDVTASDRLLAAYAMDTNASDHNYTGRVPPGMTLVHWLQNANNYLLLGVFEELRSTDGATGTRALTPGGATSVLNKGWAALSIRVRAGSTGAAATQVNAQTPAAAVDGQGPSVGIGAAAGTADATVAGQGPSVGVSVTAGAAGVGVAAANPSASVADAAGTADATVAGHNPTATAVTSDAVNTTPGLVYRMRPTGLGLADGAAVASVPFEVGGVSFTQGTAGSRPTYLASGVNGRPALRLDGVDDSMAATLTVATNQPVTVVMAYRINPAPDDAQLLSTGGAELLHSLDGRPFMWGGSAGVFSGTTVPAGQTTRVIAVYNGASSAIYVNGDAGSFGSPGTGGLPAGLLELGRHGSIVERALDGDVYELAVYDHVLTSGERAAVTTYLTDTYAAPPPPGTVLNIGDDPGENHFDIDVANATTRTTHTVAEIEGGYDEPPYFTTAVTRDRVSMYTRVDAPTGGATYARAELRERTEDGLANYAFDPTIGEHRLRGRIAATHLPAVKPAIVLAQLFAGAGDAIQIATALISSVVRLIIRVNGSSSGLPRMSELYAESTEFEYKIELADGVCRIYYNDMIVPWYEMPISTLTAVTSGAVYYFKTGHYLNTNTTTEGGNAAEYGSATLRHLEHWHTGWSAPINYVGWPDVSGGADVVDHPRDTAFTRTGTASNAPTSAGWYLLSGPAGVTPGSVSATTALNYTPTVAGAYVFRFWATNAQGTNTDDVRVTVAAPAAVTVDPVAALVDGAAQPAAALVAAAAQVATLTVVAADGSTTVASLAEAVALVVAGHGVSAAVAAAATAAGAGVDAHPASGSVGAAGGAAPFGVDAHPVSGSVVAPGETAPAGVDAQPASLSTSVAADGGAALAGADAHPVSAAVAVEGGAAPAAVDAHPAPGSVAAAGGVAPVGVDAHLAGATVAGTADAGAVSPAAAAPVVSTSSATAVAAAEAVAAVDAHGPSPSTTATAAAGESAATVAAAGAVGSVGPAAQVGDVAATAADPGTTTQGAAVGAQAVTGSVTIDAAQPVTSTSQPVDAQAATVAAAAPSASEVVWVSTDAPPVAVDGSAPTVTTQAATSVTAGSGDVTAPGVDAAAGVGPAAATPGMGADAHPGQVSTTGGVVAGSASGDLAAAGPVGAVASSADPAAAGASGHDAAPSTSVSAPGDVAAVGVAAGQPQVSAGGGSVAGAAVVDGTAADPSVVTSTSASASSGAGAVTVDGGDAASLAVAVTSPTAGAGAVSATGGDAAVAAANTTQAPAGAAVPIVDGHQADGAVTVNARDLDIAAAAADAVTSTSTAGVVGVAPVVVDAPGGPSVVGALPGAGAVAAAAGDVAAAGGSTADAAGGSVSATDAVSVTSGTTSPTPSTPTVTPVAADVAAEFTIPAGPALADVVTDAAVSVTPTVDVGVVYTPPADAGASLHTTPPTPDVAVVGAEPSVTVPVAAQVSPAALTAAEPSGAVTAPAETNTAALSAETATPNPGARPAPADADAAAQTASSTGTTTPGVAAATTDADMPLIAVTGTNSVGALTPTVVAVAHPGEVSASGTAFVGRADAGIDAAPPTSAVTTGAEAPDVAVDAPIPGHVVAPPPPTPGTVTVDGQAATSLAEAVARPVPEPAPIGVVATTATTPVITGAGVAGADVDAPDPMVVFARDAVAFAAAVLVAVTEPGVRLDPGFVAAWLVVVAADAIAVVPAMRGSVEPLQLPRPTMRPVPVAAGPSMVADPSPRAPSIGSIDQPPRRRR